MTISTGRFSSIIKQITVNELKLPLVKRFRTEPGSFRYMNNRCLGHLLVFRGYAMHCLHTTALRISFLVLILYGLAHPVVAEDSRLWSRLSHRQRWIVAKRAPPTAGAKKVCGKQLRSLFSLICQNRYQTKHAASIEMARRAQLPAVMKRNPEYATDDHILPHDEDPALDPDSVFLDEQTASIFLHRRADEKGAYSECCLKACTISEIVGYCHPDIQKGVYGIANPKIQ
ncbi:uncharacterized protein LOC129587716 [Paramacrobiotus metropolitanus]|uniref:uncharacterized protein LOC129587716 n=1 Tax=Paramacrobiotus metropolitanus TaxID=2943436 RepID=UPI002445FF81|nr:uncharacterized protein LOC129587716 [Paramacrobiotus metropolitanus]